MAKRSKVLSILLIISISLFTVQVFIVIKPEVATSLQKIDVNSSSIRTIISAPKQYVDSIIWPAKNQTDPGQTKGHTNHTNDSGHHHEGHDGFALSEFVRKTCTSNHGGPKEARILKELFAVPAKRISYCAVEKTATTYWRRFLYMIHKGDKKFENPYDVSIETALTQAKLFTRKIKSHKEANILLDNSFSFMFVRNPYSRLLSAFVDKLLAPNPTYWKAFGIKAVQTYRRDKPLKIDGHDVTFAEFVRFVTDSERTKKNLDVHFMSIMKSCLPCEYKFDYIGRMESFQSDAVFIMDKVGINTSVDSIKNKYRELSVDDAILDSIHSPFSWKREILKYISWEKALRRIWLKLQMRGIIAMNKGLELTKDNIDMPVDKFIELARKAHAESDPVDLKKAKDLAKHEAFASVPLDAMKAYREVFINDFRYFGYEDSPSYIFERKEDTGTKFVLFNYTHLN